MVFTSDFLLWPFKQEKKKPLTMQFTMERVIKRSFLSIFLSSFCLFQLFWWHVLWKRRSLFLSFLKDYNWFGCRLCAHDEHLLCRWNQYWQNIAACCMLHYSLSSACNSWLAGSSQLPLKWLIQYKALACSVGSRVDQLSHWKPPAEFRREYRRRGMPRSERGLFEMALPCSKSSGHFSSSYHFVWRAKQGGIEQG